MALNNQTVDRIQAVWNKLGGEAGIDLLLEGKRFVTTLAKGRAAFKTVRLGLHKTPEDYLAAIKAKHQHKITSPAVKILNGIPCSEKVTDFELVVVTVRELGIQNYSVSIEDVYARAIDLGYLLCPAEIGPALRLQYPLQESDGPPLHIAMEPIKGIRRIKYIFSVESHPLRSIHHPGYLALGTDPVSGSKKEMFWSGSNFVFALRSKAVE